MGAGNRGTSKVREFLRGVAIPATVVAVWQLLSMAGKINPLILPAPSAVLVRWYQYLAPTELFDPAKTSYIAWLFSGELLHDAFSSMYRVVVGFVIGAGLALPLGLAMGSNEKVYKVLDPLVQVLRPIPPIAYIPLSILWFGLGNAPAIFLISLGAFFPILMNTISGVRHVDGIYI
ncbi:MAG: ABC transporter permease, partial [Candidatus Deferrimicrobiaceae bacterium]